MSHQQIFEDRTGKRRSLIRVILIGLTLVASVALTVFCISLGVTTAAKPAPVAKRLARQALDQNRQQADLVFRHIRNDVRKYIRPEKPAVTKTTDRVVMGYYVPWEQSGLDSLRSIVDGLTHVAPAWLRLDDSGFGLDTTDFDIASNPNNAEVTSLCQKHGVRIIPVISNAYDNKFLRSRVLKLLNSPTNQDHLFSALLRLAKSNKWQGFQFDFEELSDVDYPAMSAFLRRAARAFSKDKLELSIAAQASTPSSVLAEWAQSCSFLVLMVYDEHEESGAAGPIASIDWVDRMLNDALQEVPEDKLVMGIGNYAYDWIKKDGPAEAISFQEAMAAAAGYRDQEPSTAVIRFDPVSLNATFNYEDESGLQHTVWMLDAMSAYNQWKLGAARSLRGAALWALGSEDPAVWKTLDIHHIDQLPNPDELEPVSFPFEVSYTGQGEVLKVLSRPQDGHRTLTTDSESGFIDSVEYQSYATTYLIQKSGHHPGKIVLTFDDGPDPQWTPQILDILKTKHAPAVFFCVGNNVESNPDLARRIVDEGHEIGSHSFTHPNLGAVTERRAQLELTATQRVIESVTGRSTILFRPPYNADSQPQTVDEVRPVDLADKLGYITIGENVDPNDWAPLIRTESGETRRRTASDIIRLTLDDLRARKGTGEEGNIVLLHDAGGERSQTVAALGPLIDSLRAEGYQIVSLSTLLGKPRTVFMPSIPQPDWAIIDVDRLVFQVWHWCQMILTWGFLAALGLGTVRVLFVIPLAWIQSKRPPHGANADFKPSVSVLIAAYNEEKTIIGTLESVLKSTYPIHEIIVIDDGSKDATAEVVAAQFAEDPRVQVISKANGGKASALNRGIESSSGELLFCIDADTQLEPQAIGKMVGHFVDPQVGAVAGNVQVGNLVNLLTIWQGVEYRTSQNLDRRAYEVLNGITVVPGAIGMWRRDAVVKAGNYSSDTLAEDMDLTWRVRIQGNKVVTEPTAVAWTEAPETWSALFRQRFRWAYGSTQCLWKHRSAIGRYGWFGRLVLPMLALFQIGFQILGPFVDFQILITLAGAIIPWVGGGSKEFSSSILTEPLRLALELYALFFCLEFIAGWIAYRMDKAKPWPLAWLFIQRFAYRQLMYLVMLKSLWRALTGVRQGWGKLHRTGRAVQPTE